MTSHIRPALFQLRLNMPQPLRKRFADTGVFQRGLADEELAQQAEQDRQDNEGQDEQEGTADGSDDTGSNRRALTIAGAQEGQHPRPPSTASSRNTGMLMIRSITHIRKARRFQPSFQPLPKPTFMPVRSYSSTMRMTAVSVG